MVEKVLVVSPHPDDETLGAGGFILKHIKKGNQVYWLNFTNMKEEYGYTKEKVLQRNHEINQVKEIYRFNGFYNLELEPSRLDTYEKNVLINQAKEILDKIKPDTVILPYKNDVHSDHRTVFEVMFSSTKIFRSFYIKKILMMEVVSETDFTCYDSVFSPNYYVDITEFIDKKIQIAKLYSSEIGKLPFPRSEENIKALAINRGAASGCKFAEAFILVKSIE